MCSFIPPTGALTIFITYQRAEIIYDAALNFTNRFLS